MFHYRLFMVFIFSIFLGLFNSAHATLNFQKLAIYYSRQDNVYWLAMLAINPDYQNPQMDTLAEHAIKIVTKNETEHVIPATKLTIIPLGQMNYRAASQYTLFRVNLIIDNSSSISDANLDKVHNVLERFIKRLPVAFEGQIIHFSDDVQKLPFTKDKNTLINQIKQPYQRSGTALYDAVAAGVQELQFSDPKIPLKFSVVFTDGEDTASKRFQSSQSFIDYITRETSKAQIPLFAVGVGGADEQVLTNITKYGMYLHSNAFPDIDRAFDTLNRVINDTYLVKIPAVSSLDQIECIYLMKRGLSSKYSLVQDFCN
ncbi:hypothetical protein TI03_00270 [Achromatium sp. WMS1]|nr:hypothetical protein TI03_00270 [Achromatium sp. WMS1]